MAVDVTLGLELRKCADKEAKKIRDWHKLGKGSWRTPIIEKNLYRNPREPLPPEYDSIIDELEKL